IHQTRLSFVGVVRLEQLMRARIFPASRDQPTIGFTFNLLRSAHLESLEYIKKRFTITLPHAAV
ncbi:hypothetical protein C8J57DRAFT_1074287, partial [Mycena rebaudengoi]